MRAVLLVLSLGLGLGSAYAGALEDRLGQLEYDSRIQRADMDIIKRQQALDGQDARDRETRRRTDDMIEDFRRSGTRGVPVQPIEMPR